MTNSCPGFRRLLSVALCFGFASSFLSLPASCFQSTSLPSLTLSRKQTWGIDFGGASLEPRRRHELFSPTKVSVSLDDSWEDVASFIASSRTTSVAQLETIVKKLSSQTQWQTVFSKEWFEAISAALSDVVQLYAHLPVLAQIAVWMIPALTFLAGALYAISFPPDDYRSGMEPYVRGNYDPIQARAYYSRRLLLVVQRLMQLLRLSNKFLIALVLDQYIFKTEEQNRAQRAAELLELITKLGPTAIKVGQALSVRPDLIPTEYAEALSTLQDQVPPFDGAQAKDILQRELGSTKFSHLKNLGLNSDPVASASIGQVYKGLIDDRAVAVKVQRPNVLAEIALDLYLVREWIAPIYQAVTRTSTDLQGLANEWGRGFIAELDYRKEAVATIRFTQDMAQRGLTAVTAPRVVTDYSTEKVLITEWVDGTRLDQSDVRDVPRLCSVALNAYLVMLLETQVLHCDPHPGNLLRTKDGKLCILDWGMTLEIDPNLQYSLLEYVAHLTSNNYDELPDDMVKLGFLKAEKLEFAKRSGVLEPLKYFLKQAGEGGGGSAVRERIFTEYRERYPGLSDDELRVEMRAEMKKRMSEIVERESVATGITVEVEELQRQNRDSFMIPEWFLYTSRAFLTLEGVSLQADPNYSIIKSCFPYVARRLVADDDPRARKALRDLLYGASDALDVDRLSDLADGFSSYTTTTKTVNQQPATPNGQIVWPANANAVNGMTKNLTADSRKTKYLEAEAAITLAKDSADILLAPSGNLVQNLLVEESVLASSANFKDALRNALLEGPQRFRDSLPFGAGAFLPQLPFERQLQPFVKKTMQEQKAQELAEKLSRLVVKASPSAQIASNELKKPNAGSDTAASANLVETLRSLEPEQAALVLKELRQNLPRYGPLVGVLGGKFASALLNTASLNIETTLSELEQAGKSPDEFVRVTAKGISVAAQRSAAALTPPSTEDRYRKKAIRPRDR